MNWLLDFSMGEIYFLLTNEVFYKVFVYFFLNLNFLDEFVFVDVFLIDQFMYFFFWSSNFFFNIKSVTENKSEENRSP